MINDLCLLLNKFYFLNVKTLWMLKQRRGSVYTFQI